MIIFVILGIGGIFLLAFLLAGGVVFSQGKAKKTAKQMLSSGQIDRKKAKGILRVLAQCKDNEGRRLYAKLADAVES